MIPFHTVLIWCNISRQSKYIRYFSSGGPNISSKIEINYPEVQIFRYISAGGNKNRGLVFTWQVNRQLLPSKLPNTNRRDILETCPISLLYNNSRRIVRISYLPFAIKQFTISGSSPNVLINMISSNHGLHRKLIFHPPTFTCVILIARPIYVPAAYRCCNYKRL